MAGPLVNRVAQSGIITINLEEFFPKQKIVSFDLKDHLFMEMILKEKDFRAALKEKDWSEYQDCILVVYCSTDAIIPMWAYMLITTYAQDFATEVYYGDEEAYLTHHYKTVIGQIDLEDYKEKRIVIKGCSDQPVPAGAYLELTKRLKPHVLSLMFGEPCSTVPIYKRPRK